MKRQKIVLEEEMPKKAKEFILNIYPILNNELIIKKEIHKFLGNEDYKEYRKIRDPLIWNDLIVFRHGTEEDNYYYSLEPKGVEYIKQENPNYKIFNN